MTPPPEVLDLFAVPDAPEPVPGGAGRRFRAGDLVLSPDRDPDVATWLNPVLARLAVRLDEDPARRARDLRVAMPVPARDGSWVVDGWGATRHEPGATGCDDLEVTLAAGRVLHAQLAVAVPSPPPDLTRAERVVLADADLGPEQLVHVDLAGNVLLDGHGAPLVVDVVPAWGPPLWAEALCVLDSVVRHGAESGALLEWTHGSRQQAMLRAVAWRTLVEPDADDYAEVASVVAST